MRYVCLFITFEGKLLFVAPFCLHDASIARLTAPLGSSDQQASCRPAAARRTAPCLKFFACSVSVDMHLHTCVYDIHNLHLSFIQIHLIYVSYIIWIKYYNYLFPNIPKTHPVDPVSRVAAL